MDQIVTFQKIWESIAVFRIEDPEPIPQEDELWCGYAREFYKWIEEWILPVDTNLVAINQAKVVLLDKYLEWRKFVPRTHQDYVGSRGHICIFHAFIRACEHIQVAELRLHKPMLFLPKDPPIIQQPAPTKYRGPMLFLGEIDE